MRLVYSRVKAACVILATTCLQKALASNAWVIDQVIVADHLSTGAGNVPTLMELSALSLERFTTISHPAFPGRSARIKKSDFCDGGVDAFTGYIDIGTRHLFFYFFESRSDPDNDDVLLWTNGGPGGSSATGLFMELGPCSIESSNKTGFNPYSWNSNANIFFIDQPVGTGFSYADFGETVATTEEGAKDIAAFVATFFETFSKFKGRDFHLSGESYGGRYLPVYAAAVYDQNEYLIANGLTPVNLKSVLIGNGVTDFFEVIYSYYDIQCTSASITPVQSISACVRMRQALPRCKSWTKAACLDHFDFIDCNAAFQSCKAELVEPYRALGLNPYDMTLECGHALRGACYSEQVAIEEYLNQAWVRAEIGIDSSFGNFTRGSYSVGQAFLASGDELHYNQLYVAELLARGVKVLIYSGTYDWIANWIGNERWTLKMEWPGREAFASQRLQEWHVDGKAAGKFRTHENFTFATIYGAGHLVPHDKPVESLKMLQRWLSGSSLGSE